MIGPNYVTSPYGTRIDPFTGEKKSHSGIDIRAKDGAPVFSFDDGIVAGVGSDSVSGNFITINHKEGFRSSYSHLSQQDVKPGDKVVAGQRIGLAGSTGRSTAAHLHFALKQHGTTIDPTPYLSDRRLA
jgi:murein DD-endopeptidase MepM/ murein hydrolase activator NlpD